MLTVSFEPLVRATEAGLVWLNAPPMAESAV